MANVLASLVGKRILAETARNHFGQEDPYFEEVPASRLHRAFGKKTQKRRKAIPPGLSQNDSQILTQVKRRAYRLDYALFSLCGIRFGWGSAIGLIPFIGDAADAGLAMMVVNNCEKIDGGLPTSLRMRMVLNVIFDFLIGLVPFVGDVADAIYKCNTRNAIILEQYLREKGAKAASRRHREGSPGADISLPDEFDRYDKTISDGGPAHAGASGSSKPAKNTRKNPDHGRWFGGAAHPHDDLETGVVDNSKRPR
ncbi:PH domain protein [Aspergillus terreus]|uniref:PH domain protein n=1 Tax=Aspergillus terreus TaxID=33178 RepID=A0A5M3YUX1_ASPTE|nr:hypothetical protein ATETN484_0004012900 [Aspergillus terreus]GFF13019.1 PH domain protein [Aspergillus terreus]